MKYRKCTSNERVWCTTKLAKLSFNHSISIHSWRFSIFNKNRPAVIGFVLLWSTTTVPNITFQLSKTKVKKWFPCRVYYSLGFSQEPNTLLVPGIRVMSSAESRKYYKHSAQNHISYGITYLVRYSSSCIPAGTAVHNQQDRRRASDGGRAMYVHSKYGSSITCRNRLHTYFSNYMVYISSGAAVYNLHER